MVVGGLRERKKERTRDELAAAALALFRTQGFERTTVEEIAAACEVSSRTFFRYFDGKDEVLFADGPARRAALLSALASRPADEAPLRSLRHAARELAEQIEADPDRTIAVHQVVSATPSLRGRLLDSVAGWEADAVEALARRGGRTGSRLRVRVLVGAATAALWVAVEEWVERPGGRKLSTIVGQAFDVLEA